MKPIDNGISVSSLIQLARRRIVLILVPTLLLATLAGIYAMISPDRFQARALLMAEQQDYVRPTSNVEIQEQLRAIRVILFSRTVLDKIVREFGLFEKGHSEITDGAIEGLQSRIHIQIDSEEAVAFHISFRGEDRQQVMCISNRLAELLIERTSEMRGKQAREASGFINDEIEAVRQQLESNSATMRDYRQRFGFELPENQIATMNAMQSLQNQLQSRSEAIITDQAKRTALLNEIQHLEKEGALVGVSRQSVRSTRDIKLDELRFKLAELRTRYTPEHPEVKELQQQIAELALQPSVENGARPSEPSPLYMRHLQLKSDLAAIDQRLTTYRREVRALPGEIEVQRRRIQAAPEHEKVLSDMKREADNLQAKYQDLIKKQQGAGTAERLERLNRGILFRIVEPASLPTKPYEPKRLRIVLGGTFIGLCLGLGLGFLTEHLDSTFADVDEFQSFTDLRVLAIVPRLWPQKSKAASPPLDFVNVPPIAMEQYRTLAMRIKHSHAEPAIILVTSTAGGEGKSVSSVLLASALTEACPGSTLLIDSDLRKPTVKTYLGLPETFRGDFGRLISQPGDDFRRHLFRRGNMFVLPAQSCIETSAALLGAPETQSLIARLKQEFRFIVIDAPPLLPLADAHILARTADDVVFVVRARKTPRRLFRHAVESIETKNVVGVVLNDVDYSSSDYSYAFEYYSKHYSVAAGARRS